MPTGKPWKYKERKGYKHDPEMGSGWISALVGIGYGDPGHYRPHG